MANLLKDLAAALATNGVEKPPKGFMTSAEHAKQSGFASGYVRTLLSNGITAGKVERAVFRVQTRQGVKAIPHYRVKA